MGDFGSAAAGGMNMIGTMYSADRYYQGVRDTNKANQLIHDSDNRFNSIEAEKNRDFQAEQSNLTNQFNAEQADLNRSFQSSEADRAREWSEKMVGQQIADSANAYQKAGINPAAAMSGSGSAPSASFPSGGAASGSAPSGSAGSAAGAIPMQAPGMVDNPISSFIEAFQSSQRTNAEVQGQRINNEIAKTDLRFRAREKIMGLRQQKADIAEKLSSKDLNVKSREKMERDIKMLDNQIDVYEASMDDFKAMNHSERIQKEQQYINLCLQNTKLSLENEFLPRLLGSQINLNQSQAKAVLIAANAATQQALAAKINAKTGRLQYRLDKNKWFTTYKENVEAQTRNLNASSDIQEQQHDIVPTQMMLDQMWNAFGSVEKMVGSAAAAIGGSFVLKGVKGAGAAAENLNPYEGIPNTSYSY